MFLVGRNFHQFPLKVSLDQNASGIMKVSKYVQYKNALIITKKLRQIFSAQVQGELVFAE